MDWFALDLGRLNFDHDVPRTLIGHICDAWFAMARKTISFKSRPDPKFDALMRTFGTKTNWTAFLAYHSCGVIWIGAFLIYWWVFQREGRLSSFGDMLGIFVLNVLLVALLAAISIEMPLLWPKSRCESPIQVGRSVVCLELAQQLGSWGCASFSPCGGACRAPNLWGLSLQPSRIHWGSYKR